MPRPSLLEQHKEVGEATFQVEAAKVESKSFQPSQHRLPSLELLALVKMDEDEALWVSRDFDIFPITAKSRLLNGADLSRHRHYGSPVRAQPCLYPQRRVPWAPLFSSSALNEQRVILATVKLGSAFV